MNETFAACLLSARAAARRAGESAADAAYLLGKGAGALAHAARRRFRAKTLESKVETALQEVGAMLYATHTGRPTDSKLLLNKLQEIDGLRSELSALESGSPRKSRNSRGRHR